MKKLASILALLLLPAFALGQTGAYSGHTFVGGVPATTSGMNSSNYMDGIIPGASVTVYLTGTTTKATIYADGSNTPLSNPFFSNLTSGTNPGGFIFWAAQNQGLDIQAQGGMGNASCTTSPLCYPTATTLQTDVYPNNSISPFPLPISISIGGTGATTAPAALANLGAAPAPAYVSTAPSGACNPNGSTEYLTTTTPYTLYTCNTTWQQGGSGGGGGSGTVNSGTTGQIAYYPANGTAVSGETTVPITAGGTGATTAAGALVNLGVPQLCPGTSGVGTAYVCNTAATFTAALGSVVIFEADIASGASATLAVNGGTAYPILPVTFTGSIAAAYAYNLQLQVFGGITAWRIMDTTIASVFNGGTGATTAAGALTNLGAAPLASPIFTGTVTAPTFSGSLAGHSSLDLSLSGGALTGAVTNSSTIAAAGLQDTLRPVVDTFTISTGYGGGTDECAKLAELSYNADQAGYSGNIFRSTGSAVAPTINCSTPYFFDPFLLSLSPNGNSKGITKLQPGYTYNLAGELDVPSGYIMDGQVPGGAPSSGSAPGSVLAPGSGFTYNPNGAQISAAMVNLGHSSQDTGYSFSLSNQVNNVGINCYGAPGLTGAMNGLAQQDSGFSNDVFKNCAVAIDEEDFGTAGGSQSTGPNMNDTISTGGTILTPSMTGMNISAGGSYSQAPAITVTGCTTAPSVAAIMTSTAVTGYQFSGPNYYGTNCSPTGTTISFATTYGSGAVATPIVQGQAPPVGMQVGAIHEADAGIVQNLSITGGQTTTYPSSGMTVDGNALIDHLYCESLMVCLTLGSKHTQSMGAFEANFVTMNSVSAGSYAPVFISSTASAMNNLWLTAINGGVYNIVDQQPNGGSSKTNLMNSGVPAYGRSGNDVFSMDYQIVSNLPWGASTENCGGAACGSGSQPRQYQPVKECSGGVCAMTTSDTSEPIGIASNGNFFSGSGKTSTFVTTGVFPMILDGPCTAGDYVTVSSSTVGPSGYGAVGHDTGSATPPTSGWTLGNCENDGSNGSLTLPSTPSTAGVTLTPSSNGGIGYTYELVASTYLDQSQSAPSSAITTAVGPAMLLNGGTNTLTGLPSTNLSIYRTAMGSTMGTVTANCDTASGHASSLTIAGFTGLTFAPTVVFSGGGFSPEPTATLIPNGSGQPGYYFAGTGSGCTSNATGAVTRSTYETGFIGETNAGSSFIDRGQRGDNTTPVAAGVIAPRVRVKIDQWTGAALTNPMTTQGDTMYEGASAPVRLGIGTAGQVLTVNSGATAPSWGLGMPTSCTTGGLVYGNSTAMLCGALIGNGYGMYMNSGVPTQSVFFENGAAVVLSATFSPATAGSYSLGIASKAWGAMYLGGSTYSVGFLPGAQTGNYTLTAPVLSASDTLAIASQLTPTGVGLGSVTNDVQTLNSIVPNSFTGFRYGNGGSVDTVGTAAQINTLLQGLSGCTTATYVYVPQSGTCVAPGGGSMTWPSSPGYSLWLSGTAWSAPAITSPSTTQVDSAVGSTTSYTVSGGQDASSSSALGAITVRGANQTGAGGAGSAGGSALIQGGNNASTTATTQAGDVEILPGSSTGASTPGLPGLLLITHTYSFTGTYAQWELLCYTTTATTVTPCAAEPINVAGVAVTQPTSTTVIVAVEGSEVPILASATATVGQAACGAATATKITPTTTSCTTGVSLGWVEDISHVWPAYPDGTSFPTLSGTLPLVRLSYLPDFWMSSLASNQIPFYSSAAGAGEFTASSLNAQSTNNVYSSKPIYATNGNQLNGTAATAITATSLATSGIAFPATTSGSALTYRGQCHVVWQQATAVATVQFGINGSTADTHMSISSTSYVGTTAVPYSSGLTDITAAASTNATASLTPGVLATTYITDIWVALSQTTTANTLTLYGLTSNASDALDIMPGTFCTWLP